MDKYRVKRKRIIWITICLLSFAISLGFYAWRTSIERKQVSQQAAERWSDQKDVAQISCFFSETAYVSEEQLIAFEHQLDSKLEEASIKIESENPGARLWADAYSARGKLSVSSDRGSLYVETIGVGGDFFLFHPQVMEDGGYFSGSDLNKDYVVIDEEIAWQLFGGIDVAGKFVNVGGVPHLIIGVIKRPQTKMDQVAGLADPIMYVSMETLKKNMGEVKMNHYEIVMPNPVKSFAMDVMKECLYVDEREAQFVMNTDRYSLASSLQLLKEFGFRSMSEKAIIYPYWENLARGYEDILALLSLFMVIFFAVPTAFLLFQLIYRWKHKKWTARSLVDKAGNGIYQMRANHKAKKDAPKEAKKHPKKKELINIKFDEEEEDEKE